MATLHPNMTDYDRAHSEFKLSVPEYCNFTCDVVEGWAAREPDRVALILASASGDRLDTYTFLQLAARANQFAHGLLDLGLGKGDRVLVMLPKCHEWYVALLAMFKLGIVPIPSTTQCTPRDIRYRLDTAEAGAVLTNGTNRPKFDEALGGDGTVAARIVLGEASKGWLSMGELMAGKPQTLVPPELTRSDDDMLLYFTSGTVSHPKMVLHTQASYGIAHEITARFWQDLHPGDMHWTITDVGWAKIAWGALFGQWIIGAHVFMHANPRFEAKTTLELLSKAGVTTFCAPPTVYRILVQEDLAAYNFSSVRHCMSAGEPLNPEVIRAWEEATGTRIYDGYGQTETVNCLANFRCMPVKAGSMGKPTPGFQVSIVDDAGNELPLGEEGHVAIRVKPERPVGLFKGYWRDPAATEASFRGDWYFTGDRGYCDEDGYFWFVGRADDVILSSGYRIGPFEVESALVEHPAVQEAAAVGLPDPRRGETVTAFVVLAPGYEGSPELATELQHHVRDVTAPYKYPRRIHFVETLPKTISGKIRRSALRALREQDPRCGS